MNKKKTNLKTKTKRLQRLDKRHVWHPFTQMRDWEEEGSDPLIPDPLIIERGSGNYLIDTLGNRYLDGVSSLWVTVHGHRKKEIDRAVTAQLKKIAHSTLLGLSNVPSIELAQRLAEITPRGLDRVFFSDNGSTSVEIALKMSIQYWNQTGKAEKTRFVSFTGAYHGDTFGSMGVGDLEVFVNKYRPLIIKPLRSPYPYCYRCPIKKTFPDCKLACLDRLEAVLKRHSGRIAACIIEPLVQGAAGIITAPEGFLRGVRRLTKKYNVLLIADEVATGFARTGTMFACEAEAVVPDLICLAKGLTGGYLPLAATVTSEKIYKAFLGRYEDHKTFFHGHTYTGNPLGAAAAIANLDLFKKERILAKLGPKIKLLGELLTTLHELPHVGDVRQRGLMVGVELVADRVTKKRFPLARRVGHHVCMATRKRGVILRPLGDTIVIMPPLSIKRSELKRLVAAVYESIEEVTG